MLFQRDLLFRGLLALCFSASACAQTAALETTTTSEAPTAVSDCHMHGVTQYCVAGTEEYEIIMEATPTGELPTEYTDCHPHGSTTYCFGPGGTDEVQLLLEGAEEPSEEHGHDEHGAEQSTEENCHFHAGVEHCVGAGEAEDEPQCDKIDRDYNVPLRIGLLFVILVTSAIGVFSPIFIERFKVPMKQDILLVVKQFGTGVIISTAFIHLYTHAYLMFTNRCLGELEYEGTTSAIVMAGIIVSFAIDYASHRFVRWRKGSNAVVEDGSSIEAPSQNSDVKNTANTSPGHTPHLPANHGHLQENWATDALTVGSLEAGILFHSILIGLTLVVAGDSVFLTLFAVILFHQMFEGLALGSMIAQVPTKSLAMWKKYLMALAFTLITPIGMAIGIGILGRFNGNDRSTIIAIGTLDAFSAGILVWVGIVEMLAKDWMEGPLINAGLIKTFSSGLALVAGMIVMSVLGKWA